MYCLLCNIIVSPILFFISSWYCWSKCFYHFTSLISCRKIHTALVLSWCQWFSIPYSNWLELRIIYTINRQTSMALYLQLSQLEMHSVNFPQFRAILLESVSLFALLIEFGKRRSHAGHQIILDCWQCEQSPLTLNRISASGIWQEFFLH